jgi:hypothetical protein
VVRVGGITPYLEIAALARAFGVPLAPHFMMELSGQLLCCLPNGHILENIDGGSLTISERWRSRSGSATATSPRPIGPVMASSSTATSSPPTRSTPEIRRSPSRGFS